MSNHRQSQQRNYTFLLVVAGADLSYDGKASPRCHEIDRSDGIPDVCSRPPGL